MINYTYTFSTSGDVQTALDNGSLGKPYVAYITSTSGVDWNTKDVTPDYIAEWINIENGYALKILNDSPSAWAEVKKIGTINCWYKPEEGSEIEQGDVDIFINFNSSGSLFNCTSVSLTYSEIITLNPQTLVGEVANLSIVASSDPTDSDWEPLEISYVVSEGVQYFEFIGKEGSPFTINTINPS